MVIGVKVGVSLFLVWCLVGYCCVVYFGVVLVGDVVLVGGVRCFFKCLVIIFISY